MRAMKEVTGQLHMLRSEVAYKCFEKFKKDSTQDPGALISFLQGSFSAGRSFDDLNSNFRDFISDGDVISFINFFGHLDFDQLSQVNEIADLKIDRLVSNRPNQCDFSDQHISLAAAQTTNVSSVDTFAPDLSRLVLAFNLPASFHEFREMTEEQKKCFYEIGIDGSSARAYAPTKCQRALLRTIQSKLLEIVSMNNEFFLPSDCVGRLRSELIQLMNPTSKDEFQEKILPICNALLNHISEENIRIKAATRITNLAQRNGLSIEEIEENSAKGINPSFKAIVNGKKCYIKTCSNDPCFATNGFVDPNELLVYKIMEYTNFGPKTNFLFGSFSSADGRSSISRSNFIITEDLNQYGDTLLLDTECNYDEFQDALRDRNFTIDLSAASILSDILSLADALRRNGHNYGLLIKADGSRTLQFVDHLPNANNGLFSNVSFDPAQYSPRDYLQRRCNQLSSAKYSAFQDLSSNREAFPRESIECEVAERLANLPQAIENAINDVRTLVIECKDNFVDDVELRISGYLNKIQKNVAVYDQTKFSQERQRNFLLL